MVYINSRGEVVDENSFTVTNIFWKIITFITLFFKSLIGIEDNHSKKNDDRGGKSGSSLGGFYGNGGGGGSGGGGGGSNDSRGPRKFGPRGFRSITDLPPPPPPPMGCSGGACG